MRRFEKKERRRVEDVCVLLQCDLCGRSGTAWCDSSEWEETEYVVERVTISYESGSNYPDGKDTITHTFDVCPTCWVTEIVSLFKARGARPYVSRCEP